MVQKIVPHDVGWAAMFRDEAQRLQTALAPCFVAVHHIGSTAVAGIFAKPIIDILVEVTDICAVDDRITQMRQAGFEAKGEFGLEGRRYFRKSNVQGQRTHHIHIYKAGTEAVTRHLAFRDYLVAHPKVAQAYSDLKTSLVAPGQPLPPDYQDRKDPFVEVTEQAALVWYQTRIAGT